jgi:hypothetical protein
MSAAVGCRTEEVARRVHDPAAYGAPGTVCGAGP